jgi:integral membrane protein
LTDVQSALTRYRVIAYVVGVLLIVLTLVGIPLQLAGDKTVVSVVGPIHGFAYMVYLVLAFHLAIRARWPWGFTILVLLAGTVPFLSFVAERKATRRVHAALGTATRRPAAASAGAGEPGQR